MLVQRIHWWHEADEFLAMDLLHQLAIYWSWYRCSPADFEAQL